MDNIKQGGIETKLIDYLDKMGYHGIELDINRLLEIKEEVENKLKETENKIYDLVGHKFNIASAKELSRILYEELRYPILKRTDKGNPSTGKLAIELLSEEKNIEGDYKYIMAHMVEEYRKYKKLLEVYLKGVK